MALRLGALHDALLEAGVSPEKAVKAAEEAATYESRLAGIESRLNAPTWMAGANVTLTLALLAGSFAMWSKLGDLGVQIAALRH